jgi:hypothetical protein
VPDDDILRVERFGGGSYDRPGRWMRANICRACATRVVATATQGHDQNSRYGIHTLRRHLRLPSISLYRDSAPHAFARFEIEAFGQPTVCVSCGRSEGDAVHITAV